jgi:hypothetical protein
MLKLQLGYMRGERNHEKQWWGIRASREEEKEGEKKNSKQQNGRRTKKVKCILRCFPSTSPYVFANYFFPPLKLFGFADFFF